MIFFAVACFGSAFCVSYAATLAVRRWAPGWNLIDHPASRKVHSTPTPLGGGIAIWLGVLVPLLLATLVAFVATRQPALSDWIPDALRIHLPGVLSRTATLWSILAAGTVLAVMGLLDDLHDLPWKPRLLVQACTAVAVVQGGVQATVFVPYPWIGWALTVCWILVLINSFNFLDNMDGLSAGIGLIASVLFAVVMLFGTSEPRWLVAGVLLILSGALSGFLCFNRPPASIFMGDSGSYFLGLVIASMTVSGTFYETGTQTSRHVMFAPICILAIPLYDFCSVVLIRLREGRSPFHADKCHFSHRLVEVGLSRGAAVLTVHLTTLTTGLGALLLYCIPHWTGAFLVLALIGCILAIVAILETAGRRPGET